MTCRTIFGFPESPKSPRRVLNSIRYICETMKEKQKRTVRNTSNDKGTKSRIILLGRWRDEA
jgi:hypothetical protein